MELERGGLSEGEDCSAPGEDGGFRAFCLGTSSEPGSLGWGVYVCLCGRCIRFPVRGPGKIVKLRGATSLRARSSARAAQNPHVHFLSQRVAVGGPNGKRR